MRAILIFQVPCDNILACVETSSGLVPAMEESEEEEDSLVSKLYVTKINCLNQKTLLIAVDVITITVIFNILV